MLETQFHRRLRTTLTLGLVLALSLSSRAAPTIIQAKTANRAAGLGDAYTAADENFVAQRCLDGRQVVQGISTGNFYYDSSLNEKSVSHFLGLDADARARFGAVDTSLSAHFLQNSTSSAFSVSGVWASEYLLPSKRLVSPKLSAIGRAVTGDDDQWLVTCGTEYVDQISYGARLLFSVRIDFTSESQKQEFESHFSVAGPVYGVSGSLREASTRFSRDTTIHVNGIQFGGDVAKLTAAFGGSSEHTVQCSLGNLETCAKVLGDVIDYAANVKTGFPSQLAPGVSPGGAPLEYRTSPYSSAGIRRNSSDELTALIREARTHLHSMFEDQFRLKVLGDRLLEIWKTAGAKRRQAIGSALIPVEANLDKIVAASEICYSKRKNCPAAVKAVVLAAVDKAAFKPPEAPQGSIRLYTSERAGVLTRPESVAVMMACKKQGGHCVRPTILADSAGTGSASTVLLIKGVGLRDATLYFGDKKLGNPISLEPSTEPSEKRGPGWAILVLESTRGTAGWVDIDLSAQRQSLWKEGLTKVDGTFYLLVTDAFGRGTRFDIENERWDGSGPNVRRNNRWWDDTSEGLVTAGRGRWSLEVFDQDGRWVPGKGAQAFLLGGCGGGGGGGGGGGARNELMDNGGGGGGGAGSSFRWLEAKNLAGQEYMAQLGTGGAGGPGGPGGGASGSGAAGAPGSGTQIGPSDVATGRAADARVWRWEGAPGGGGGIAPRGGPVMMGYVAALDGSGGPGGAGAGFFATGGRGGNPDSRGAAGGARAASADDPSSGADGGAGGSVENKEGHNGGGGGGGGAGLGAGGAGGTGGGNVAEDGGNGSWCAGGGGGGGYGEQNRQGRNGGRGGGGAITIVRILPQ